MPRNNEWVNGWPASWQVSYVTNDAVPEEFEEVDEDNLPDPGGMSCGDPNCDICSPPQFESIGLVEETTEAHTELEPDWGDTNVTITYPTVSAWDSADADPLADLRRTLDAVDPPRMRRPRGIRYPNVTEIFDEPSSRNETRRRRVPETNEDLSNECWECGRMIPTSEVTHRVWTQRGDRHYCMNHTAPCNGCQRPYLAGQLLYIDIGPNSPGSHGYYCGECYSYCPECDWRLPHVTLDAHNGYCSQCEERPRSHRVRGYGSTRPVKWWGGPVPKDDSGKNVGYYIGFELEISAAREDGSDTTPIVEWANEHGLDDRFFDCKEDGSVRGFEIATQPMTPEFFESIDWESFFVMLNEAYPIRRYRDDDSGQFTRREPRSHGLHVHIGRQAFERDDVATAAFSYLIGQDNGEHLERIGRRSATSYCQKVPKPVSQAIVAQGNYNGGGTVQFRKLQRQVGVGRGAINMLNPNTIEIRSARSTRDANELRDAVRLVYVSAEYIRHLRKDFGSLNQNVLHWTQFAKWVGKEYPEAFASIADMKQRGSNRMPNPRKMW